MENSAIAAVGSNGTVWTATNCSSAFITNDSRTFNEETSSNLTVNGRDILQELDEIRNTLMLLSRDVNMEEKYPKLKELKDAYDRQLVIYQTWDAVKGTK
jgi:hypothetical protein